MQTIYTDKFPFSIEIRLDKYNYSFVSVGWIRLITDLDNKLREIHPGYEISQIKQKYGQLRYYANFINDEDFQLIFEAEKKSTTTCEACGNTGVLRDVEGYKVILCDEHFDELWELPRMSKPVHCLFIH